MLQISVPTRHHRALCCVSIAAPSRTLSAALTAGLLVASVEYPATAQHHPRRAPEGMRVDAVCRQVQWQPRGDGLACGVISDDPPPGVAIFGPDGRRRALIDRFRSFPFAWRPDGQELVGLAREATFDPVRIAVVASDGSNLRLLTPPLTQISDLAWRPDGSEIWYSVRREMFSVNLTGGAPRSRGAGAGPSWSPDGTHLAFARFARPNADAEVWLADAQGTHEQRVLQLPGSTFSTPLIQWSPNGAWLGVGGWDSVRDEGYLSVAPMTNGTLGAFVRLSGVSGDGFSWSPDGNCQAPVRNDPFPPLILTPFVCSG